MPPLFGIVVGWGFVILMSMAAYVGIVKADTELIANAVLSSPIWLWILYLLIKHIGYFFNLLTFFVKNPYIQIHDDGMIVNHYEVDRKPTLITWSDIKVVFAKQDLYNTHQLCLLYFTKNNDTIKSKRLFIHTKAIIYDDEIYKKDDLFDCLCQLADEISTIKREKCPPISTMMTDELMYELCGELNVAKNSLCSSKLGRFDDVEWRLVEPIFFPALCLVVTLICFFLGTFPLSKLSNQEVSLASIAPNLFFSSIMILMGLICFNIFLKSALSSFGYYSSKIKLDNQGIKIYQHNKSKQMLFISWGQVYQARAEYVKHSYDVCIDTSVHTDDDVVATIKIRVDSLFPMLFPDYKEKAVDIANVINHNVRLLKGRQHHKSLSYVAVDVGGYGQYSFLDVVPYE